MNTFDIVPYVGAKPLLFGMTQEQVIQLCGHPTHLTPDNLSELNAQYTTFGIRYSKADQRLVEIGFVPEAKVFLNGSNIFGDRQSFSKLLSLDSCPYEYVGFIVLLDLGITLTGFHDDDPSQLAVTAFVRGRWDHLKAKFKKFRGV